MRCAGLLRFHQRHRGVEFAVNNIERLLDAGAGLAGKTHTDELTFSLNGENLADYVESRPQQVLEPLEALRAE